jgi:hypothetical protein
VKSCIKYIVIIIPKIEILYIYIIYKSNPHHKMQHNINIQCKYGKIIKHVSTNILAKTKYNNLNTDIDTLVVPFQKKHILNFIEYLQGNELLLHEKCILDILDYFDFKEYININYELLFFDKSQCNEHNCVICDINKYHSVPLIREYYKKNKYFNINNHINVPNSVLNAGIIDEHNIFQNINQFNISNELKELLNMLKNNRAIDKELYIKINYNYHENTVEYLI